MWETFWTTVKEGELKWVLFTIALVIIGALCAIVFHKLFLRLKKYYFHNIKINLWIPSIILGILVIPYRLPFCVAIIHFGAIFLIIDFITFILRKITKKEFKLLYSGVVSLIISTIVCIYGFLNFLIVTPTEYIVETDKVKKEYTIVYIADIHGPLMPMNLFKKYMNDISEINPDFIILGGDINDEFTPKDRMEELYKTIGKVKNKRGNFYTYGNHDRLKYADSLDYDKVNLSKTITDNGMIILQDTKVIIDDSITLIGREDNGSEGKNRQTMQQLIANVDPNTFVIVAEHEPDNYKEVAAVTPNVDLYVCGHTHAGQMFPIGFYFRNFMHTYNIGRHKYNNLDIMISSGFGTWAMPFRTERKCEYLVIKVKPKN